MRYILNTEDESILYWSRVISIEEDDITLFDLGRRTSKGDIKYYGNDGRKPHTYSLTKLTIHAEVNSGFSFEEMSETHPELLV